MTITQYLDSKISEKVFSEYQLLIEYTELNSAFAKVKFNGKDFYNKIQIYSENGLYNYKIVEGFEKLNNFIDKNLDIVTNLIGQDLPKDYTETFKDGKTDDYVKLFNLLKSKDTYFNVDIDIKEGLNYIEIDDSNLTVEQIAKKNKVKNLIFKINSRNKIEVEVGDDRDLIADLSKRIALLERMLLRLFLHVVNTLPMNEEIITRYSAYASPLIEAADNNIIIDRIDLEDEVDMITTLEARRQLIKDIVKEEYLDKILPV